MLKSELRKLDFGPISSTDVEGPGYLLTLTLVGIFCRQHGQLNLKWFPGAEGLESAGNTLKEQNPGEVG
jgi:hypothetical protein